MNNADKQYLNLLERILTTGVVKESGRPGMPNTKSVFGHQMRFDLREGFPLLTTKKLSFKNIAVELLWFLKGDTNIQYLVENGCNIWNDDAFRHFNKLHPEAKMSKEEFVAAVIEGRSFGKYKFGDLGGVYGEQWRKWQGKTTVSAHDDGAVVFTPFIDQIKNVIENINKNPYGRRHIVTAWNPAEVDNMALPPCHVLFQFNCRPLPVVTDDMLSPKYILDCALTQRSCDTFLGVPYNIASYALLTHIVAHLCNMVPGEFIWTGNDVHIYDNHFEPVMEQLTRVPRELPRLKIDRFMATNIEDITLSNLILEGYNPHPAIKGDLSVGI